MDKLLPSQNPPGNLKPSEVPMFVSFGFDDNGYSGLKDPDNPYGIEWASKLFHSLYNPDGERCSTTFYFSTSYIEKEENDPPEMVKTAWRSAIDMGHEPGNHTHSHPSGRKFSVADWEDEINLCNEWLEKPVPHTIKGEDPTTGAGINSLDMFGFRVPFLDYNDNAFTAAQNCGFDYDCSIEEGWQKDQDGTNFLWPYTLDEGSPGHDALSNDPENTELTELKNHPGLWEMPLHAVIVPPDSKCKEYGIDPGLRKKLASLHEYFTEDEGKITGLDWNLIVDFEMTKAEFLATMKYTFDLRIIGNRAPMLFGAHSDVYSPGYTYCPNITWKERQEAVEEFLRYVLSKPFVRVVSINKVLEWIKKPLPLQD